MTPALPTSTNPISADYIRNLLDNALTYTSLARADGQVDVVLCREGDTVLMEVCDNGIGIDAADLDTVMQRFHRVRTGTEQPAGSGIGLFAAAKIVALSGGELSLLSDGRGHGTTARLRLPIQQPVHLQPAEAAALPPPVEHARGDVLQPVSPV